MRRGSRGAGRGAAGHAALARARRRAGPQQRTTNHVDAEAHQVPEDDEGPPRGLALRGSTIAFGDFGLQALERGWITSRQIEAARVAITRKMKRVGKVWIRVFPDKPITLKPAETRMGKGKGNPEYWVAVVKPGRILFEINGVDTRWPRRPCASAPPSCRSRPGSSARQGE